MRRLFLFLPVFLVCADGFAQRFALIDQKALNTPPSVTKDSRQLAQYLCENLTDQEEKVRAIYSWLALNVTYADSTDGTDIWATPEDIRRQRPESVLRNKTAVCQGYSNLFHALCHETGIESEVITGICKQPDGRIPRIGHAWVAAKIKGKWQLFDPTWAIPKPGEARWSPNDAFFMADPKTFVLSHLPDDPLWQLLSNPIEEKRFRTESASDIAAFLAQNPEGEFAYLDTLSHWQKLDSIQRFESAAKRMLNMNPDNERIIFELGKFYYLRFFDAFFSLDSLTDALISDPNYPIDSTFIVQQSQALKGLSAKATVYFNQVVSEERRTKIRNYYSETEVETLMQRVMADMYVAQAGHLIQRWRDGAALSGVDTLLYFTHQASSNFDDAEKNINCARFEGLCKSILYNRSLVRLETASALTDYLISLEDAKRRSGQTQQQLESYVIEARALFIKVLEDIKTLKQEKPLFQFVLDREQAVQEGLVSLRMAELQLPETKASTELMDILAFKEIPEKKADRILKDLKIQQNPLLVLLDTVTQHSGLSEAFRKNTMHYLQQSLNAQFQNAASLDYKVAVRRYNEIVRDGGDITAHRSALLDRLNNSKGNLKKAIKCLDALEDLQMDTPEVISKQRDKLEQLDQMLSQLMESLK